MWRNLFPKPGNHFEIIVELNHSPFVWLSVKCSCWCAQSWQCAISISISNFTLYTLPTVSWFHPYSYCFIYTYLWQTYISIFSCFCWDIELIFSSVYLWPMVMLPLLPRIHSCLFSPDIIRPSLCSCFSLPVYRPHSLKGLGCILYRPCDLLVDKTVQNLCCCVRMLLY